MADYRALAQALDPYAMDTGGITPDTIKALKTVNKSPNLLGMIADIGRGGLSNLESLVRGGVAQFGGTPVDTLNTIRTPYPMEVMGDVNYAPDKQVYGGTKDILGMMPKRVTQARPETAGMEELGTVMGPGLAKGVAPAVKGYLSLLGNEINAGMTGQPTRSIIGQITPKPLQLDVYHGTPHTLPPTERNPLGEFDASKIGTGEGAQAYGYGIYTAENPDVARAYQNTLSKYGELRFADGTVKNVQDLPYNSPEQIAGQIWINKPNLADAKFALSNLDSKYLGASKEDVLKQLESLDVGKAKLSGNFYKADLPDEMIPKMLDWDKPLSQQSDFVKQAFNYKPPELPKDLKVTLTGQSNPNWKYSVGGFPAAPTEEKAIENALKSMKSSTDYRGKTGQELYKEIASTFANSKNPLAYKEASDELSKLGITGIRYLDEGSRNVGKGTSNFVIFPSQEQNIKILERNAEKTGLPTSITNKSEVKNVADDFANQFKQMGFEVTLDHSGSKAGASSYLRVSDPTTGRFLNKPIRISDHSKGAKELDANINVLNPQEDFAKITSILTDMRKMGATLVVKQDKYAQELIANGVNPKTAYQRAKTEITENKQ